MMSQFSLPVPWHVDGLLLLRCDAAMAHFSVSHRYHGLVRAMLSRSKVKKGVKLKWAH